ncbi:N-acylneuraminate cytidylyltransferase [Clarias magur]|uniref:N-acylneuraminate cytidylyltransferase n=1 Tax=Clarias magur TaxID=1594786 RepID=A0A8J4UEM5_CLAMG|nr:N-acylneuraminate cytidylyltransferase [Clarias magur]
MLNECGARWPTVCRHAPGIQRDKFESFHKIKGPKVSREGTTDKGGREEDFGVAAFLDCRAGLNVSELHHLTSNMPQFLPAVARCSCHAPAAKHCEKEKTGRPKLLGKHTDGEREKERVHWTCRVE